MTGRKDARPSQPVRGTRHPSPRAFVLVVVASLLCQPATLRSQDRVDLRSQWEHDSLSGEEFNLPLDDEITAEVETLLPLLASPKYGERKTAKDRLMEIGPGAFAQLSRAYRRAEELDLRLSIEEIVREAYLQHHVFSRNGFLGVQQSRVPVTPEDEPRIEEGYIGIQINRIIPGTAAEAVGILAKDVIVALDGRKLTGSGAQAINDFGEMLRTRGQGAAVSIRLFRGPLELELEAILGPRPRQYYPRNQSTVSLMLAQFEKGFRTWWALRFGADTSGERDD